MHLWSEIAQLYVMGIDSSEVLRCMWWCGDVNTGREGLEEEEGGKGQERHILVKPSFAWFHDAHVVA